MTPDERASLQDRGSLLATSLLNISIDILFSGFFLGLWILASLSLFNRSLRNSWARRVQFAALLMNFLAAIGPSMLSTAAFAIPTAALDSGTAVNATLAPYDIAKVWIQQVNLLINDAVVIWRAWVLYSDKAMVPFLLCLIFSATLATSFAALALISQVISIINSSKMVSSSGISIQTNLAYTLNNAASALSLATNLVATFLILLKLWKHRGFMGRLGFHRHPLTSSQRIMLLLVEAGLIFCITQAVDLFVGIYLNTKQNITPTANFVLEVVDSTFWASLSLYLPVVILLAANNRTMIETFGYNSTFSVDMAHEEGRLESSTTGGPETAQLSAHDDRQLSPVSQEV